MEDAEGGGSEPASVTVAVIRWTLTFRNLGGKTVAAHIHEGKAGVAGPVVLALCGPCKTGQTAWTTIGKDVADLLENGGASQGRSRMRSIIELGLRTGGASGLP